MKVWGVNRTQLELAAAETNCTLYGVREVGRAIQFTLRPDRATKDEDGNHRWQRVSSSVFQNERRVFAVCWHGHRAFMRAVFAREPEARIKTNWIDYRGSDDFEERHDDTAYINVGSQMYPVYAGEACKC